jgi:hypothetical protein
MATGTGTGYNRVRIMTGLTVQLTPVNLPDAEITGDEVCVEDQTECCEPTTAWYCLETPPLSTGTGTGTGPSSGITIPDCACEAPSVLTLVMDAGGSGSCDLEWDAGSELWGGAGTFEVDDCGTTSIRWQVEPYPEGEDCVLRMRHSCDGGSTWSAWLEGLAFAFMATDCSVIDLENDPYTLEGPAGCEGCSSPRVRITGSVG